MAKDVPKIIPIVEGKGEFLAVRILLQRVVEAFHPGVWLEVLQPIRLGRDQFVKAGGVEDAVSLAAKRVGHGRRVLILLDADKDCPHDLGPQLLERAQAARSDFTSCVVLAKCEYEAWFLASAASLAAAGKLPAGTVAPPNFENIRDAKGWLNKRMLHGVRYQPTEHQASFTARFDIGAARSGSPSFDKLCRDVASLL